MPEHPAVHPEHSHHMKYWGGVRDKAEECVKSVLEGGNERVTLHEAIGKAHIEHPEDWDALMDFCKENEQQGRRAQGESPARLAQASFGSRRRADGQGGEDGG